MRPVSTIPMILLLKFATMKINVSKLTESSGWCMKAYSTIYDEGMHQGIGSSILYMEMGTPCISVYRLYVVMRLPES